VTVGALNFLKQTGLPDHVFRYGNKQNRDPV